MAEMHLGSDLYQLNKLEIMEKGQMRKSHRISILREANKRIKLEVKDFVEMLGGEQEQVEDKYIDEVCKERGWDLSNFYFLPGDELNKLLNRM